MRKLEQDALVRLRKFVRKREPGSCKLLSKGDECTCPLCDLDLLAMALAHLADLQNHAEIWLAAQAIDDSSSLQDAGLALVIEGVRRENRSLAKANDVEESP